MIKNKLLYIGGKSNNQMLEEIREYVCYMRARVVVHSAMYNLKYKYKLVNTIINF